ncbi:hypothetical protein SDC9_85062 [bioreactor metagenome]|uniref:Mor transcription activator domain-containing protein n=1 Tax=bioreactor metagenome TaxID=1076179 RepID=A0A644ZIB7_9ZZZZ|nr:CD3324 family protein [Candidatus Pelethousia sp.]
MGYTSAIKVLPEDMLKQIQEYVDGKSIYIPRKISNRKQWGEGTDTKEFIHYRNECIFREHRQGLSAAQLAKKFYLTEKSIRRILRQKR